MTICIDESLYLSGLRVGVCGPPFRTHPHASNGLQLTYTTSPVSLPRKLCSLVSASVIHLDLRDCSGISFHFGLSFLRSLCFVSSVVTLLYCFTCIILPHFDLRRKHPSCFFLAFLRTDGTFIQYIVVIRAFLLLIVSLCILSISALPLLHSLNISSRPLLIVWSFKPSPFLRKHYSTFPTLIAPLCR